MTAEDVGVTREQAVQQDAEQSRARIEQTTARVMITRNADNSLTVSGLTAEENVLFVALHRALAPVMADQIRDGLQRQADALQTHTDALTAQVRELASRAAQEVCDREIIARVKRVERNAQGDIVNVIEEPRR